jgi:hypothetical protein
VAEGHQPSAGARCWGPSDYIGKYCSRAASAHCISALQCSAVHQSAELAPKYGYIYGYIYNIGLTTAIWDTRVRLTYIFLGKTTTHGTYCQQDPLITCNVNKINLFSLWAHSLYQTLRKEFSVCPPPPSSVTIFTTWVFSMIETLDQKS